MDLRTYIRSKGRDRFQKWSASKRKAINEKLLSFKSLNYDCSDYFILSLFISTDASFKQVKSNQFKLPLT